jgi:uncharacterized protein with HEPN domain
MRSDPALTALRDIAYHIDLALHFAAIAWREMAGAGNVYRHDHEDVAASHVWSMVQKHLPPLRAVIQHELAVVDPSSDSEP